MFGRGWEPARATIVAKKEIRSIGNDLTGGTHLKSYDFVADVRPASGGGPFRTVMHEPFDERVWRQPFEGDIVPALWDAKHQKAKFDTATVNARDRARKDAQKAAAAQRFDAILKQDPDEVAHADSSNPKANLWRLRIQQAEDRGDAAEVERLTAELAELE